VKDPSKVIAFDLGAAGLASLRDALPGWQIETIDGTTPDAARLLDLRSSLLVVGVRSRAEETWRLCRALAFPASDLGDCSKERSSESGAPAVIEDPPGPARVAILVLLGTGQEALVTAALDAGAQSCLVLPCQREDIDRILAHARVGNQAGRHTLDKEQPQSKDRWRDDGGEA
jgi:DNA-binding NarL/FixJ family response regulator